MKAESPEFNITLPPHNPDVSNIANAILRLSCIPEQLALEDRTLVNHRDGRAENVAEHSLMLAVIAPAIAEQYFPELDENLVARYATIHDAVEAYVGDTPTHNFGELDQHAKEKLETAGLERMAEDFAHLPGFVKTVKDYEAQIIPEARFVRVLDKVMPLVLHFLDDGATLRTYTSKEKLSKTGSARNEQLRREYPEFSALVDVREELTKLAARSLFE